MMTIKAFARLCSCNAQTLRYYDKIGLLKPVRVDPWSGYRYYAPAQSLDFVKIKNLQAADFTIGEIKTLLALPDQQVYDAFDRKIAEQTQKLERIREIQQLYLTEKTMIENIVHSMSDYLLRNCSDPDILREFGLDPADAPDILARLRAYLDQQLAADLKQGDVTLTVNDEVIRGGGQVLERIRSLTEENLSDTILLGDEAAPQEGGFDPKDHVSLWERHGWEHIREFIDDIPPMEAGRQYCFRICLRETPEDLSFPMFLLGAMLQKRDLTDILLGISCEKSGDQDNHFALLLRKSNH